MALFQLQKLPVSFTTLEHGNVQKQQWQLKSQHSTNLPESDFRSTEWMWSVCNTFRTLERLRIEHTLLLTLLYWNGDVGYCPWRILLRTVCYNSDSWRAGPFQQEILSKHNICYGITACLESMNRKQERLCGIVVTVPGCSEVMGSIPRRYQIFWVAVGLERGPLSLVSINKELLERKVAAKV
jgi:hypothetical protein